MTSFLSLVALISVTVAYKLDPIADLPLVQPIVTAAIVMFAIVSVLDPGAAGVGSAWLIEQYVAEAMELAGKISEGLFEGNPDVRSSSHTTTTTPS